ncbi:hypothetical protein IWW37_003969 [Coemansia sp. RSA 2050]|nr:hypothetical protein IWW37_003969 [Coemansia sp. RSA 2050]KAJ2730990.1 hypothetical protein IW152_004868 [Coemansia sp. BCRC 34962]
MTENRHSALPDSARLTTRTKLTDSFQRQKAAAGSVTKKRKGALVQQSPHILNQAVQTPVAEKDPKRMAKVEIPVSLDIDPFSTTEPFSPQSTMDEMLLAKEAKADAASPESCRPAPQHSEAEFAALSARAVKAETENVSLRHALLETKTELAAAEERLREKDVLIKDQEERINDLIDTRVPREDLDDFIESNKALKRELEDNEALLAECEKTLEEYARRDEARGFQA